MNKKTLNLIFIWIFVAVIGGTSAVSQESDKGLGGSSYSAYGIGMPLDITSHNFIGQGLLGVSGITDEFTNLANPALWGGAFITQASTGLKLSKFNLDNGSTSQENSNFASEYIQMILPLSRGKLGLSVSLYPVTRSDFRVLDQGTFYSSASDTINYVNEVRNSGGVNKFELGFGFRISKNIYFGYAPSVAFITLEKSESIIFDTPGYITQDQSSNITGAAFSQRFGISANFQKLFSQQDKISFGATLNLPYQIGSKREFTSYKQIDGISQEIDLTSSVNMSEGDVYIPLEASFGLGYAPSPFINIAAEGTFQKWSEFSNDIDPAAEAVMSDRMKVGVGGQYHPYKRNSRSFFSRFKYSGGVSYDTGHLTIQGNDISTLWINTGLGILGRNSAISFPSFDVSFQYGFRGTTDNNLIKERIWTLGLSVNLNERMFVRPKLR